MLTEATRRSAMVPRIRTHLLVLILLLHFSSGIVEGFSDGMNPINLLHKDVVHMKARKLLVLDVMLDYDYAGPNPKHDPRKGKPGGGIGKNP